MTFGAPALTGQRAHLTLDFRDEVVKAPQVDRGFVEATLGTASAIAIQADTSGFFKQLATIIGAIGEQGIDHAAFDDDAGVGAETCAAHEILNVAQATGRTIEQVLALAGTQQSARQHHFLERHRQFAVVVFEVQRHFRHVHGLSCRRTVEDDVFHLRTAHRSRALLSQHPAYRVGHVGLATAIRADNRRHPSLEHELGVIGERLEPVYFELRQTH